MSTQRQVGAMADAQPGTTDLTGKELRFCKRVAGGITVCGDGEKPAGIISEGKAAGKWSSFNTGNQLKVVCSGVINPGAKVASDADGAAQAAGAGDYVYGESMMTAASAAGDVITINVTNEGILA